MLHSTTPFQEGEWTIGGHSIPFDWLHTVGAAAAWVLFAIFVILVTRAILVRHRYRAVDVLGESECDAIRAAIHAAERRTVGEIGVVVLERSDRHPGADWVAALFALILGSALLAAFLPWERPELLLACQLALGGVGFLCSRCLPDFKRRFISETRATEMAREQALQEFHLLGLHRTQASTGVLIFVTLLEHRVIVLGDEGIDDIVGTEHWMKADAAILRGIKAKSLKQGLEDGIRYCADILAEHFPWEAGDRDELPNHVIVRRE